LLNLGQCWSEWHGQSWGELTNALGMIENGGLLMLENTVWAPHKAVALST
jgi:hypothetical protein